jgi:uncharacterized membrane protein YgdD (TMEM256/DUF423 family)
VTTTRVAAVVGFLGVALGAFGAHALPKDLPPQQLDWWRTAVLYHLVHAVALLAAARGGERPGASGWSFVAGVAIFCGTLYAMALGAPRWLGAVTPVGGVAFLAGWLLLLRRRPAAS